MDVGDDIFWIVFAESLLAATSRGGLMGRWERWNVSLEMVAL